MPDHGAIEHFGKVGAHRTLPYQFAQADDWGDERGQAFVDHGEEKLDTIGEMDVERAVGDTGFAGDFPFGCAEHALGLQGSTGGFENLPAGTLGLRFALPGVGARSFDATIIAAKDRINKAEMSDRS